MPNVEFFPSRESADKWWALNTPRPEALSLQGFADTLRRGLPDPAAIELTVFGPVNATAALGLYGRDNGYLIGNSVRSGAGRCLHNDATLFAPSLQGLGYGSSVTANMIAVAGALQLPELRLVACMGGLMLGSRWASSQQSETGNTFATE